MNAPSPVILPLGFGPSDRRLFGIFHSPAPATAMQAGVLLCNAFGQEAVRAQRMMRVLAERLARAGHAVLRFDYHGTGDSMGDDLDGDLSGWAGDVREADRHLRALSAAVSTIWVGMRLGATVALRAAQQAPDGLARLVLWDPVIDGERYLQHLRQRHVASLLEAFSLPSTPTPVAWARNSACLCDEAIGFALSPLLRSQLAALSVAGHRWPARPESIIVVTDPEDADGRDLAAVCTPETRGVQAVVVHHGTDWTSDLAGNSALVPAAALMQLVQQVGAPA